MPVQQRVAQTSPVSTPTAEQQATPPDRQSRYGNGFLATQLANEPGREALSLDAPATGPTTEQARQPEQVATPVAPLKVRNPLPVVQGEQRRTVLGVQIIGRGVSPSALDLEATQPRASVPQHGWNNLGTERGVVRGRWMLITNPTRGTPPSFVEWAPGANPAAADEAMQATLSAMLTAWDAVAPPFQQDSATEATKEGLRALGYHD